MLFSILRDIMTGNTNCDEALVSRMADNGRVAHGGANGHVVRVRCDIARCSADAGRDDRLSLRRRAASIGALLLSTRDRRPLYGRILLRVPEPRMLRQEGVVLLRRDDGV